MGIPNFTKLFDILDETEQWNQPFDSILIDAQSLLYGSLEQCFPYDDSIQQEKIYENLFFFEVSSHFQSKIAELLIHLFRKLPKVSKKEIVIICSFDGRGVPMKWPTQRNRRAITTKTGCSTTTSSSSSSATLITGKDLYRISLFENNVLSARIRDDLIDAIRTGDFYKQLSPLYKRFRGCLPDYLRFVISGCDVEGEGEHKMFHMADALNLMSPVIASIDNDVFVLGLIRIDNYQHLQLYRFNPKQDIKNLSHFAADVLKFPVIYLIYASFLFGNDFIPPLVSLTDRNSSEVATALLNTWEEMLMNSTITSDEECIAVEKMPVFYALFLQHMKSHIRYEKETNLTPADLESITFQFWIVCLWIRDYYTHRDFPQKYAANLLWDHFDRNALLRVLFDSDLSSEIFSKALEVYHLNTLPKEHCLGETAADKVFNAETLQVVSRLLLHHSTTTVTTPSNSVVAAAAVAPIQKNETDEGFCHDIKVSTRKRK